MHMLTCWQNIHTGHLELKALQHGNDLQLDHRNQKLIYSSSNPQSSICLSTRLCKYYFSVLSSLK